MACGPNLLHCRLREEIFDLAKRNMGMGDKLAALSRMRGNEGMYDSLRASPSGGLLHL